MSGRRRWWGLAALALVVCGCSDRPPPQAPPAAAEAARVEAPAADAPPAAAPLEFVERVTAGAESAKALPLIIAVHGLGDQPENFVRLFEGLPFPARVVAPRGPIAHGRGRSWFPIRIPVRADDPEMEAGLRASAAKLADLARWLTRRRPTVGRPVITGFSQGGMLSFAVAIAHPDVIAGAVPVAGALPTALWRGPGPTSPVVALHGSDDRVVPYAGAERLVEALVEEGAAARLETFPGVAHRVPPAVRRALYGALAELAPAVP